MDRAEISSYYVTLYYYSSTLEINLRKSGSHSVLYTSIQYTAVYFLLNLLPLYAYQPLTLGQQRRPLL